MWEQMKYMDYPGSVLVGMQEMIHNEKMLKSVRYIEGHDEQAAEEMSKKILREPSHSPERDTAYKAVLVRAAHQRAF